MWQFSQGMVNGPCGLLLLLFCANRFGASRTRPKMSRIRVPNLRLLDVGFPSPSIERVAGGVAELRQFSLGRSTQTTVLRSSLRSCSRYEFMARGMPRLNSTGASNVGCYSPRKALPRREGLLRFFDEGDFCSGFCMSLP